MSDTELPPFKIFPTGKTKISKTNVIENTDLDQYMNWLDHHLSSLNDLEIINLARSTVKNGHYSKLVWEQEHDHHKAIVAGQRRIAAHLYLGKPLNQYNKRRLKSSIKKQSTNNDDDSIDVIEESPDDHNDIDDNTTTKPDININNLVNNPQFISAMKSLYVESNKQLINQLNKKRSRPVYNDDDDSIDLNSNKRVKFNDTLLSQHPFNNSNSKDHLLKPKPKVV